MSPDEIVRRLHQEEQSMAEVERLIRDQHVLVREQDRKRQTAYERRQAALKDDS